MSVYGRKLQVEDQDDTHICIRAGQPVQDPGFTGATGHSDAMLPVAPHKSCDSQALVTLIPWGFRLGRIISAPFVPSSHRNRAPSGVVWPVRVADHVGKPGMDQT